MEFVASRKRRNESPGDGRSHGDVFPELPESITSRLGALRRRTDYELSRKGYALATILDEYNLSPQKIYQQMVEFARRGKSPQQLETIMDFLMVHYNSVMNGEPPIPLDSNFRKVPFS